MKKKSGTTETSTSVTFQIQLAPGGDCSFAESELTVDDVTSYIELTDALRVFESVALRRFFEAPSGPGVGQKAWLVSGIKSRIRSAYGEVLAHPVTGILSCSPYCGSDGFCYECKVEVTEEA